MGNRSSTIVCRDHMARQTRFQMAAEFGRQLSSSASCSGLLAQSAIAGGRGALAKSTVRGSESRWQNNTAKENGSSGSTNTSTLYGNVRRSRHSSSGSRAGEAGVCASQRRRAPTVAEGGALASHWPFCIPVSDGRSIQIAATGTPAGCGRAAARVAARTAPDRASLPKTQQNTALLRGRFRRTKLHRAGTRHLVVNASAFRTQERFGDARQTAGLDEQTRVHRNFLLMRSLCGDSVRRTAAVVSSTLPPPAQRYDRHPAMASCAGRQEDRRPCRTTGAASRRKSRRSLTPGRYWTTEFRTTVS